MRLSLFQENRLLSESGESNEIDIAPVMNMFIVLVTFLISMAVFTHVAIMEFTLPPNVGAGLDQSKGKPKLRLTVRVGADYVGIVLGDKLLDSLPVAKGKFPFDTLAAKLQIRRKETALHDEIIIASRDEIAFKQVVHVMDICRETGFSKVGLSSATVNPEAGK
ncbi:MAG: biopolymer transporter ExbD [Chitinispirillaceae bacterium]|jgi:biopolymer transport protein ExbD